MQKKQAVVTEQQLEKNIKAWFWIDILNIQEKSLYQQGMKKYIFGTPATLGNR